MRADDEIIKDDCLRRSPPDVYSFHAYDHRHDAYDQASMK